MEAEKGYKKGLWTEEEDRALMEYVRVHGKGRWNRVAKITGLKRCGKSCRLRWINYLSPSIKHGDFSEEEDDLIIRLHNLLGNRWSLIAGRVPGRTDNQVKNHWNTHLSKKLGIKKERTKLRASSQTFSAKIAKNVSVSIGTSLEGDLSIGTSLEPPSNNNVGGEDQKVVKNDLERKFELFETEELMTIEDYESHFLFSHDGENLNTPSLVELLDECPFDFVWHGL